VTPGEERVGSKHNVARFSPNYRLVTEQMIDISDDTLDRALAEASAPWDRRGAEQQGAMLNGMA
jgi:hypothetical protein